MGSPPVPGSTAEASHLIPPSLFSLLLVNFVATLSFSVVLPFLVFLVMRWGGNALVYGVAGATYSAFQFVGAPVLGRWSDRWGRRRVLLLSQGGTLASWIVLLTAFFVPTSVLLNANLPLLGQFTLTLPLLILLAARAASGLTGGSISVANAYLADITPEDRRNESFGKMAVSQNLGFVAGPALAGVLGATAWGEMLPVMAAVTVSLVATLLIAFRLPESRPCLVETDPQALNFRSALGQEPRPCFAGFPEKSVSATKILRLPGIGLLISIYFLVMLAFNIFYVAFPVYAIHSLKWSVRETGTFFAILSLLMVLVQGPVLARAARVVAEPTLVFSGSVILSVSFLLYAHNDVVVYVAASLLALGNGLMWPAVVSLLSKHASTHQGAVQGFAGSSGAVASVLGLLLGGALYGHLEGRVFLLSFGLLLLVAVLALRLPPAASASKGLSI